MSPRQPGYFILVAALLAGATAVAHHNTGAAFDLDREITIEGEITRYEYKNPHIYFYVRDKDGTEWRVEGGPLALMNRFGWSRSTLKAGDQISMIGNPSRRAGRPSAFLQSASSNGVPLPPTRGEPAFTTLLEDSDDRDARTDTLAGTWVTVLHPENSPWIDDPSGLSLTPEGRNAIESFDEKTMSPVLKCIPMTAPVMMIIPDTKSIEIGDDVVTISSEFDGATRTIYLAGNVPDGEVIQGRSIGVLQDNELRIETTGFAPHRTGGAFGLPSSNKKRLTETLTLDESGKSLVYRFEVEDPEYLSEPFGTEVRWAYRPDAGFQTLPCDLENSRLFLDE